MGYIPALILKFWKTSLYSSPIGEFRLLEKSRYWHAKKREGGHLLECYTEIFKAEFLHDVNEVLFEIVKTALKDMYL